MSILLSEEQRAIGEAARRLVAGHCDKQRALALLETVGDWDDAFWGAAVAAGWPALTLPQAYGGLGLGLIELGQLAAATGAAPAAAPFLTGNCGAARALLHSAVAVEVEHWLPGLAQGTTKAAIAFAEADGVLPDHPAVCFDNGRLTGIKHGVAAGLAADFAVVWARHRGEAALVLAGLGEVRREAIASFDNSQLHAHLHFADTPGVLLAAGEAAHAAARDVLAAMAVVAAHEQLGGAEALLFIARDYALARKAFGQPIGAFQSVKHRIAELYGLVEIARANCLHAAACDGSDEFPRAAAAARLSATEAYDTAARDCVQIHGALGATWDAGLHLHMRRARSLAILCGNMLFWEDWLVGELLKDAA